MTTLPTCNTLPSNIELYRYSSTEILDYGFIERSPLLDVPQNLEKILQSKKLTFPIYITPFKNFSSFDPQTSSSNEVCVYSVRLPSKVNSEEFFLPLGSPAECSPEQNLFFGVQTAIYSLDRENGYMITPDQKTYAKNLYDGTWHFLGNSASLNGYLDSFFNYVDLFTNVYSSLPLFNAQEEPPNYFNQKKNLDEKLLNGFFSFLKQYDFELWQLTKDSISFNSEDLRKEPFFESSCGQSFLKEAYAYVNSGNRKIYFFDKMLYLINEKNYQTASIILSHELRHKKSYDAYALFPSDQLISSAIDFFFHLIPTNNKDSEKEIIKRQNEFYCQLLPVVLEDEISAHVDEIIYTYRKKDKLSIEDKKIFVEGLEILNDYLDRLVQLPLGLFSLSAEYYLRLLDRRENDDEAAQKIKTLLQKDFYDRIARKKSYSFQCLSLSTAFQELIKINNI